MKHEVRLGVIAHAKPGDYFSFVPPEPDVSYRFAVGPEHGRLGIFAWDKEPGSVVLARNETGHDYLDFNPGSENCVLTVLGSRTAFQFVVTRTPSAFMTWLKSLLS